MAEDSDQRTEAPSHKKLSEARQQGQIALSREVNTWFVLATATAVVTLVAPSIMTRIAVVLRSFIEMPDQMPTDRGGLGHIFSHACTTVGVIVALPLGMLTLAAIAGPLLQAGLVISAAPLMPSLSRISPLAGMTRLFSLRSLIELLKGMVKLMLIGGVMALAVLPMMPGVDHFVGMEPMALLSELKGLLLRMIGGALGVVTVIAAGDYFFNRFEFMRKMRMTKQEVKEEHKQSDGDPVIRGRLRQLRMERARRRMMQAVPKADVVVTNPTHYAVAMKYDPAEMAAPIVVAKGADLVALAIRKLAQENDVAIVESPPLARALYAAVEVDQEIPPEHYRAVAEIISYVFRLKGRVIQN
ncbi:MAG TPA: flagellar biosynthesis protein FlhB [Alphaproteobacteria bacterium]|nr:flagellar biosynthesis protein FlhB [Alphaproteobacteria bacterium]